MRVFAAWSGIGDDYRKTGTDLCVYEDIEVQISAYLQPRGT
uniref:Uncharacterized protein n=1 Tax=Candidatus Kentrum sp. TC TaxID=2126339 RepID=A0A450ZYA8_9GAMM|nr:MAG: hypothetical protein BECKTC1821F_GA0114240_102629 [Candidatus Kentron sp. TC]